MTRRSHGRRRFWNVREERALRRRYPHEPTAAIARDLDRTVSAICQRARLLELVKTTAYLASPAACRLRRGGDDHPGRATQFKPGQVPANKGLRRPGWGPGRMKTTQFKPGGRPHTWVPIGTEVVDEDGYRKRKIADDRTRPSRFNWRFVHVLVWETAHGPVPPGHAVVFKDHDRSNIRLDNLELITRRALLARNSVHNLPKPLAQAVQLLGALNRQIRRRSHAAEQDRRFA